MSRTPVAQSVSAVATATISDWHPIRHEQHDDAAEHEEHDRAVGHRVSVGQPTAGRPGPRGPPSAGVFGPRRSGARALETAPHCATATEAREADPWRLTRTDGAFTPTPSIEHAAASTISVAAVSAALGGRGRRGASIAAATCRRSSGWIGLGSPPRVRRRRRVRPWWSPPPDGPTFVAVGVGEPAELDAAGVRATPPRRSPAPPPATPRWLLASPASAVGARPSPPQAAGRRRAARPLPLRPAAERAQGHRAVAATHPRRRRRQAPAVRAGAERGRAFAGGDAARPRPRQHARTAISPRRASPTSPIALGGERGLDVEVFDKDALVELGCGGLLGVNAGQHRAAADDQADLPPAPGEPTAPARRWSARASCTTRAASASSRATRSTPR